jgi:hypothetical protein
MGTKADKLNQLKEEIDVYISYHSYKTPSSEEVCLDGYFTVSNLKKIIEIMEGVD